MQVVSSYCCVKIEGKSAEVHAVCSLSLLFCAVQAAVVETKRMTIGNVVCLYNILYLWKCCSTSPGKWLKGKDTCCHAWWVEFNSWDSHKQRKETIPSSCLVTSCICTHTKYKNKIVSKLYINFAMRYKFNFYNTPQVYILKCIDIRFLFGLSEDRGN